MCRHHHDAQREVKDHFQESLLAFSLIEAESLLLKYELYNSGYLACDLPDDTLVSVFRFTVREMSLQMCGITSDSLHMFARINSGCRASTVSTFTHCNFLLETEFQVVQALILLTLPLQCSASKPNSLEAVWFCFRRDLTILLRHLIN